MIKRIKSREGVKVTETAIPDYSVLNMKFIARAVNFKKESVLFLSNEYYNELIAVDT